MPGCSWAWTCRRWRSCAWRSKSEIKKREGAARASLCCKTSLPYNRPCSHHLLRPVPSLEVNCQPYQLLRCSSVMEPWLCMAWRACRREWEDAARRSLSSRQTHTLAGLTDLLSAAAEVDAEHGALAQGLRWAAIAGGTSVCEGGVSRAGGAGSGWPAYGGGFAAKHDVLRIIRIAWQQSANHAVTRMAQARSICCPARSLRIVPPLPHRLPWLQAAH